MGLPPEASAFLEAMKRRFACKLYDGQALPREIEDYILDCGRLSPSSFGLEHWKFFVNSASIAGGASGAGPASTGAGAGGPVRAATGTPVRDALYDACFAQDAVKTAGMVVAILVHRAADYEPDSVFARQRSERFPGGHPVFRDDYKGYYEFLAAEGRIEEWARAQAYIACANMMTGAAAAGIDSCAIEGYREADVLAAFGAAPVEWRVGIVAVFGRAAEPPREKIREPLSKLVEYRR